MYTSTLGTRSRLSLQWVLRVLKLFVITDEGVHFPSEPIQTKLMDI